MTDIKKMKAPGRDEVEILGSTFDEGTPHGEEMGKWNQKFSSRSENLKYLQTAQRYFFSEDWFGSEKRKNPA
jgi:hypothetical protein